MFDENGHYDFRFQIADGRVWLFDHSLHESGEVAARVDQVMIDGEPAKATKPVGPLPPAKELKTADWCRSPTGTPSRAKSR